MSSRNFLVLDDEVDFEGENMLLSEADDEGVGNFWDTRSRQLNRECI